MLELYEAIKKYSEETEKLRERNGDLVQEIEMNL